VTRDSANHDFASYPDDAIDDVRARDPKQTNLIPAAKVATGTQPNQLLRRSTGKGKLHNDEPLQFHLFDLRVPIHDLLS
jgi:hypothetical protein